MKKRILAVLMILTMAVLLVSGTASATVVTFFGIQSQFDINDSRFPDPAFRTYIKDNFDTNYDNKLSHSELNNVEYIDVSGKGITSLKGIEYFSSLKYLFCQNNALETLDLSGNWNLEDLYCRYNKLDTLNVSNNKVLTYLDCENNYLNSLDVSKNTNLEYLYVPDNCLKSLDVSNNPKLLKLNCIANQISTLNVSKNPELTKLWCSTNLLKNLDVTANTKLEYLSCHTNSLTALDVSRNIRLTELYCDSNLLDNLDVTQNSKLTDLSCCNNYLTTLNIAYCPDLTISRVHADPDVEIITDRNASNNTSGHSANKNPARLQQIGSHFNGTVIDKSKIQNMVINNDRYKLQTAIIQQLNNNQKKLAAPVISSATNTDKGITLKWNAIEGAERYCVFIRNADNTWANIGTTEKNSFKVPADEISSGCTYIFTVCCINAAGTQYTSDYDPNGYIITYIAAPKLISAKASSKAGQVKVTWEASFGAEQYRVFYKEEGAEKWSKAKLTTATEQTVKNLDSGKTYYFTVRCVNEDANAYTSGYDKTGLSAKVK